jgi:hypothetical protein
VKELDVPIDGWKIGAPIGFPCVVLVTRWYGPEQAPPDVDELAERYTTCP